MRGLVGLEEAREGHLVYRGCECVWVANVGMVLCIAAALAAERTDRSAAKITPYIYP